MFYTCSNQPQEHIAVPKHELFIPEEIDWIDFEYDIDYLKFVSSDVDSLIILTKEKLIIIVGQYGLLPNDTMLIPWSGEFGIHYEVIRNKDFNMLDDSLSFNGRKFTKTKLVNFQWWDEINRKIDKIGTGVIIVSGP